MFSYLNTFDFFQNMIEVFFQIDLLSNIESKLN